MGTLEATVQGSGLVVRTQAAEIEAKATWAIETDYIIKHSEPHVEPRVHLGLKDSQKCLGI